MDIIYGGKHTVHSTTGIDCLYVRRLRWACIVLFSGVLTTVLSRPIHNETTKLLQALDPGLHNSYSALKYPCMVYHGLTIERYDQNINGVMQL